MEHGEGRAWKDKDDKAMNNSKRSVKRWPIHSLINTRSLVLYLYRRRRRKRWRARKVPQRYPYSPLQPRVLASTVELWPRGGRSAVITAWRVCVLVMHHTPTLNTSLPTSITVLFARSLWWMDRMASSKRIRDIVSMFFF